ncbi:MAG TPA: septal ring lytic transglycosylase RlpA family protein [Rhodanobacteraceae bacterium]|nr:septal ring lytic transglycosylase RlpA family protein [Rhodanobacteraceae bacterium]
MKYGRLCPLLALWLVACAHHPAHHDGVTDAARRDDTNAPQSRRYAQNQDGSPVAADIERIDRLPMPEPKSEPRSRYGNKSPYTVLGHTYRVLPTARGYHERGIASWYGTKFHGHLTSSFEPYDMYRFTAAHKTLPLPSWARVTNLDNGKSVIVRINDRGPFHDNRLIDLSYAAAVRLDIWRQGTGLVDVEAIDPAAVGELPPPPVVDATHAKARLFLQVGAFADADNAERLAARLRAMQVGAVKVVRVELGGRPLMRVRLGPLDSIDAADALTNRIQQQGLPQAQAVVE